MIRTQIQLEEAQHRDLKQVAAERGVSVAQLIREGVDQLLAEATRERQWDTLWAALDSLEGLGGPDDVSVNHDDYLADIYAGK